MKIIEENNRRILVADEGKQIRDINDIYMPATEDTEEHISYYATTIFLADNFDEEMLDKLYVEENESEVVE